MIGQMESDEGKEEIVINQHVFDYINNHKLDLHEFHNWLLNNQNDSKSIYLLGYFNYYGIGIDINIEKALELYQKAAKLDNNLALFELANVYIEGGDSNYHEEGFELSEKLAEKGYSSGINLLGYCYDIGIGTDEDKEKAFEFYQKAANLVC
ncbi:uncharacterized protein OCT59_023587 [Rhizophagus irregularis]|uniref:uncharacterized protein n=1 Tax=Rhizophagus irregularis TaxID=588596 RepID=UPI00331BD69E|nr:hypothetical protein OCT59_023587 [Rhizophagus irregularis]